MANRSATMERHKARTEPSGFHATNPFGSGVEIVTGRNDLSENVLDTTIADMFSELMSDCEMAAATNQPSSSRASPCSTIPVDGAETTKQSNAWPPLEVTDCILEG